MSIKYRSFGGIHVGTLADFTASSRKFRLGDVLMPTDSDEVRYATGKDVFSALTKVVTSEAEKAAFVAAFGNTTDLSVIGATFADLAAARTAVNTLRNETETRLGAIETKFDLVLTKLIAAALMAAS